MKKNSASLASGCQLNRVKHGAARWLFGSKLETRNRKLTFLFPLLLTLCGCGYHAAANAARLPKDLHTISIPGFQNATNTYRIEQVLTRAVVHEFLVRTRYRVVNGEDGTADAVLRGTVTSTSIVPVTFDTRTGRVSTAIVNVTMRVSLADRHGKALFENPAYLFREQYQVSLDPSSFFQEESPAIERLSRDFARTLVSNILEGF